MRISHHYNSNNSAARFQNLAAAHRKCLMSLASRPACSAVRPARSS